MTAPRPPVPCPDCGRPLDGRQFAARRPARAAVRCGECGWEAPGGLADVSRRCGHDGPDGRCRRPAALLALTDGPGAPRWRSRCAAHAGEGPHRPFTTPTPVPEE